MADPDYEYVIQPDDRIIVNKYLNVRGIYTFASFIASLVILPSGIALMNIQKRFEQTSTNRPAVPR